MITLLHYIALVPATLFLSVIGGGVLDLVYGSSFLPLHGLYCVFQ